jgi:lysophospholipase L1-like esterase
MNNKITMMLFYLIAASSLYAQIINVSHLYPFFEKLVKLEKSKKGKVNIAHIGDSHVQPDYFTDAIRKPLQQQFGDGGRGFIFPYSLNKKTTRPYYFQTDANWQICRNNQPLRCEPGTEFGLSGYGFSTKAEQFIFSVEAGEAKYRFNTIKIVSPTASLYRFTNKFQLQEPFVSAYHQNKPISSISFLPTQKQELYSLNGLIVEKDAPGLIYHNIGTVGSMASDFNANPLFFEQLPVLRPDLVIISLGTNESFNDVPTEKFIEQIELFINNVRTLCPDVPVLVTTPPISLLPERKFNAYILEYSKALLQKENIAIWDLYSFLNGLIGEEKDLSAIKIASDEMHYTASGYANQGTAFAKDFLNEYKNYKRSRK